MGFAIGYLGISLSALGKYSQGLLLAQRALARAQRLRDPTLLAAAYCMLGFTHLFGGDMPRMLKASQACIEAARQAQSQLYLYIGYGILAWAQGRLGRHDDAERSMTLSREEGARMGGRLLLSDIFAAVRAEIALNGGRIDEAMTLAEQAVKEAREIQGPYGAGFAHWVGAKALLLRHPPDWEKAQEWFAASIDSLEAGSALAEVARVRFDWGRLALAQALPDQARDQLTLAATLFDQAALANELDAVRSMLAGVRG